MGTKVPVDTITNILTPSAVEKININFSKLSDAIDNVLQRDGTLASEGDLDMNGQRIFNLAVPKYSHEPVRLADLLVAGGGPENLVSSIIELRDDTQEIAEAFETFASGVQLNVSSQAQQVADNFAQSNANIAAAGNVLLTATAAAAKAQTVANTGVGRVYETWTALSAAPGSDGDGAIVIDTDTGTHTDPVTSSSVPNSGVYRYQSGTPSGWKHIANSAVVDAGIYAQQAQAAVADYQYVNDLVVGPGDTAGTSSSRNFTRGLGKTLAEAGLVGDDGVLSAFSVYARVTSGGVTGSGVLVGMIVKKDANLQYHRVGNEVSKTATGDGPVTFLPSEFGLTGNKVEDDWTFAVYSSNGGAFIDISTEPAWAYQNNKLGTNPTAVIAASTAPRIRAVVKYGSLPNAVKKNTTDIETLKNSAGSPRVTDVARQLSRKGSMKIFPLVRSSLNTFDSGRGSYPYNRIPAAMLHPITKRAFILYDGREDPGQDYDPSAVLMRYSDDLYYLDDPKSATWSPEIKLAGEGAYQFGSSAMTIRPNGEIHVMFKVHLTGTVTPESVNPNTAYYLYEIVSKDNGLTWSNADGVPITLPATRATASRVSVIEPTWERAGCGPGGGITMADGTLCVPSWSDLGVGAGYQLFPLFLRPGSKIWVRGQLAPAGLNASESTVYQREDGRIEFNSRSNDYARRITTIWEADGTYVSQTVRTDLPVAFTCEGHVHRLSGMDQDRLNRVLLSYPERVSGDGTGAGDRTKLSIGLSYDDLATMPYFRRIYANVTDTETTDYLGNPLADGPVAHKHHTGYSSMIELSGNRRAIFWEGSLVLPDGTFPGHRNILCGVFNLSWVHGNN